MLRFDGFTVPSVSFASLLQGAERNLCVLLNTLAALLLEAPEAHTGPASPKHKGKGKQRAAAGAHTPFCSWLLTDCMLWHSAHLKREYCISCSPVVFICP